MLDGTKANGFPTAKEWDRVARHWSWSARETEAVRILATGQSRKEAAAQLSISISTLQTHLRRALWKAGAECLVDLVWRISALLS